MSSSESSSFSSPESESLEFFDGDFVFSGSFEDEEAVAAPCATPEENKL
jgi:hypothetical protein